MTGTIFSGSYSSGIVLSDPATQNPATIAARSYVGNSGTAVAHNGDAVYGAAGTVWNLLNYGSIVSDSGISLSAGVSMQSGGVVANGSAGSIVGQLAGVLISGAAGTIANFGAIAGSAYGVLLSAGGRVTNGQSGSSTEVISGARARRLHQGQRRYRCQFRHDRRVRPKRRPPPRRRQRDQRPERVIRRTDFRREAWRPDQW